MSDKSTWLPHLIGPLTLKGDDGEVEKRSTIVFSGATVTDDPDNDQTNIEILGGEASVFEVVLAEDASEGDWICSANDVDETKARRAIAANLANANGVRGVLLDAGSTGETVRVAGPGTSVAESVVGVGTAATSDILTLDTATARAIRGTVSEYVLGSADKQGNSLVNPTVPGLLGGSAEIVTLVGTGTGPAGAFAIGDVVCSANDATDKGKVKLALAANLASADASSIRVMLQTGVAGDKRQAAGIGDRLAESVLGLSTSTTIDKAVLNTSTGRAARLQIPTRGDWIVGELDKAGPCTIDPEAPAFRPFHRKRRGEINWRDWEPETDGTTDVSAKFQDFLNTLSARRRGHIPEADAGVGYYLLKEPVSLTDDTPGSNRRGIFLYGEWRSFVSTGYTFRCDMREPNGIGASITSIGNGGTPTALTGGGSGQVMGCIALGTTLGGRTVLASADAFWTGLWIRLWNANNAANITWALITGVPSDGIVNVYLPLGAGAPDRGLGGGLGTEKICWRIWIPALQNRARGVVIEGISFGPKVGTRMTCPIEMNYPTGAGAAQVINQQLRAVGCGTDSIFGSRMDLGVSIARDVVPLSGNPFYAVNGAGVRQVLSPAQVDTIKLDDCYFFQPFTAGIEHVSAGAQSKECTANRCSVAGGSQYGYYSGRQAMGLNSAGHMDFVECSFGNIKDTLIRAGGGASKCRVIDRCYSEVCPRIYSETVGALTQQVIVKGSQFTQDNSSSHRSGELMKLSGVGPLSISDTTFAHVDSNQSHISITGTASKECDVILEKVWFKGLNSYTGVRCRATSTRSGPARFAGTERITYRVDLTGVDRFFGINQTNLNRAGGYTVDLTEVPYWVLGNLFHGTTWAANTAYGRYAVVRPLVANGFCYQCDGTGGTSGGSQPSFPAVLGNTVNDNGMTWTCVEDRAGWGDGDDFSLNLESLTPGTTGRIEFKADADPGGDGNVQLGFAVSVVTGLARTEISQDTNGFVDFARSSGAQPAHLTTRHIRYTQASNDAQQVFNDIPGKRYGALDKGITLGSVQKKTVAITQAMIAALGAATTGTINVGTALPTGARLVGGELNVTTKAQNAGDTDTTTADLGTTTSGHEQYAIATASLKSTGKKVDKPYAGASISAEQAAVKITSDVNLNTITAGAFTATLLYVVEL